MQALIAQADGLVGWRAALIGVLVGGLLGWAAHWVAARLARPEPTLPVWAMTLVGAGLVGWAFVVAPQPWAAAASALLAAALLVLASVDLAAYRLPDALTLPLIGAGLLLAAAVGEDVGPRLVGSMVGYGAIAGLAFGFRRLRGREGIGMGDAKLLAAAGAWLGWRALPALVLVACALAFAWVGARLLRNGRHSLRDPLPFGAPLALAFWIVWLYGAP